MILPNDSSVLLLKLVHIFNIKSQHVMYKQLLAQQMLIKPIHIVTHSLHWTMEHYLLCAFNTYVPITFHNTFIPLKTYKLLSSHYVSNTNMCNFATHTGCHYQNFFYIVLHIPNLYHMPSHNYSYGSM